MLLPIMRVYTNSTLCEPGYYVLDDTKSKESNFLHQIILIDEYYCVSEKPRFEIQSDWVYRLKGFYETHSLTKKLPSDLPMDDLGYEISEYGSNFYKARAFYDTENETVVLSINNGERTSFIYANLNDFLSDFESLFVRFSDFSSKFRILSPIETNKPIIRENDEQLLHNALNKRSVSSLKKTLSKLNDSD